LKNDSTVFGWGSNNYGQLGDGTSGSDRLIPVQVTGLTGVTAIAAGISHSVALKNDGTVWAWGGNFEGELGDNTNTARLTPVQTIGLTNVTAIAANNGSSLALKSDGTIWAWGWNVEGQLGDNSTTNHLTPVQASPLVATLQLSITISGAGSVRSTTTTEISCSGGTCYQSYASGTSVTLVPTAASGSIFSSWVGCDSVAGNECRVTMSAAKSVTATFTIDPGLAVMSVSPMSLTFTSQATHSAATKTVTISNSGTAPLVVSNAWLSGTDAGSFAVAPGTCSSTQPTIAPGGSCQLNVIFQPLTAGSKSASLAIISNASNLLTVTVALTGSAYNSTPTVTSYQPVNGATVQVTTAVQTTFSETMDPATITSGSFTLSKFVGIKAIAAGGEHTVVLKNDGTVLAWGENNYGQTTIPTGLAGVTAIAAGEGHTVALKNDGTVVAWGSSYYGVTTVPAGLAGVSAIAAGWGHTVALKNDGTVVVWGRNTESQTTVPAGLTGVTAIAAGAGHTVALKNDGTVVAWGRNTEGQTTVPAGLAGVTAIATGGYYTMALKNDGTVIAWGLNDYGQITIPEGLTGVTAIAAGSEHAVALKNDGKVVAWGWNSYGQATIPAGLTGVTAIAAGGYHTVSLMSDGTVIAWGLSGQTVVPTRIAGLTAIAAANFYNVALKNDGTVVAWGAGQTNVPAGLTGIAAIAAGYSNKVVLKNDGTVVAWESSTTVPEGLTGVIAVAAGDRYTIALKSNGTVVAWGNNDYGQVSVPVGLTEVIAIAAARSHTVALKNDGTVVAWGLNSSGQSTVPMGLTGVIAIAAGAAHTVALKNDGSVVAWGNNDYGQTTVPAGLTGVTAIAAGFGHTVALKSDGTVVAWGRNSSDQSTVPVGLTGVIAITAGDAHTLVLKIDGTIAAWGDNSYGQSTVSVASAYETTVSGLLTYDPDTLTANFISSVPLDYGTSYNVAVTGVRSLAGVPLAADVKWSFSTADKILWVAPAAHDFGSIIINTAPANQTFTITNTNQLSSVVSAISITGPDAGLFTLTPVSCPSLTPTLAAGGSCTVNVAFLPTSAGSRNANLQVASTDPVNQSSTIPLSGSGVLQSYTLSVTVAGDGSGTVHTSPGTDISCTSGVCGKAYDLGTVVTLSATASSGSTFTGWGGNCSGVGTCLVTMNAVRSVTASFSADPVPALIGVSPGALNFSSTATHSSTTQSVTISNSGTASLVVLNAGLSGTDAGSFFITPGTCDSTQPTIAPGGSCQLDVIFQPTTIGSKSATFTITSNGSNSPLVAVPLTGSAYDPPPFGFITINGGANQTKNAVVTLTLSAYDNSGQVTEMRFSNNNSSWSNWELFAASKNWTLMTIGGDGDKTVYVQYKDASGNASGSVADTITYDTTAPIVTITAKPAVLYAGRAGAFSFTANETVSSFECQVDSGSFAACTSLFTFSAFTDGDHTFAVRATDLAGNLSSTISHTWTIDATPPDTAITVKPGSFTATSAGTFSFTSPDPTATFECSLDSSAYATCSNPYNFSSLADGSHTFSARAKDPAGNADPTPASYSWTIDTIPPDTSISGQPSDPATVTPFNFAFTATEAGSTFECRIDGGAYASCSSPYSIPSLATGSHTFEVKARDPAGNYDLTPAGYTFTVNVAGDVTVGGNSYATLAAALAAAADGSVVQLKTTFTPENITYAGVGTLTLSGGYDAGGNKQAGLFSTVGTVTIVTGALIMDGIVIR
jgi:alpha-tubulin suppressor-like RCC1 family protein